MNIKKRIPKFLSLLLSFVIVSGNVIPAYAMENTNSDSITVIDGEDIKTDERNLEDITVTYKQASSFFVTIPKTIVLDGWKESTYAVKVSGDIGAEQCVYVAPVDMIANSEKIDFYMKDQASENAKDDVVANVTHNKFHWNSAEVASGYKQDDNLVSAPDLTAGAWRGIFQMEIKLETHVTHEHNYVETIIKEPTCTETGEKTFTCDCGDSYTEEIPAKGHKDTDGDGICDECGENDSNHEHSYIETITKEPTCTEAGEKTYTCNCGDSYTEEIPSTGHKYIEELVDATCMNQGYTKHTCSECGNSYMDNYTDKLTHNFIENENDSTTHICTVGGETETHIFENNICTVCGKEKVVYTIYLDSNGGECDIESMEVSSDEIMSGIPTPTKPCYTFAGWESISEKTGISISGDNNRYFAKWYYDYYGKLSSNENFNMIITPDKDIMINLKVYATAMSYEQELSSIFSSASVSDITDGEPKPINCISAEIGDTEKLGSYSTTTIVTKEGTIHPRYYSYDKTDNFVYRLEAGHTYRINTIGRHYGKSYVCANGDLRTGNSSVMATPTIIGEYYYLKNGESYNYIDGATFKAKWILNGHDYEEYINQEVGCETDGSYTYTCKRCGYSYTETKQALGHNYVEKEVTKLATCTEEGSHIMICQNCNKEETQPIAKLEHSYVDNVCEYCGHINYTTTTLSDGMTSKNALGISASKVTFTSSVFEVEHGANLSALYGFSCSGIPASFTGTGNAKMQFTVYKYNDELAKYEVYDNSNINMGSKTDTSSRYWIRTLEPGKYYVYWTGYNNNAKYHFSSKLFNMQVSTY